MFKFGIKFIKQYSFKFHLYIFMNIAIGIISIIMPVISGKFIDNIVYAKNMVILTNYIIIFTMVNLSNIVITYLSFRISISIEARSGFSLCTDVLKHLHTISLLDLENENSSYLSQRIKNDSRDVVHFCLSIVANIILNLVGLSISFAFTIKVNYKISILIIVIALLYVIGYNILKNHYIKQQ